jgi:LuxR family maltose regulon positive regulatory protein
MTGLLLETKLYAPQVHAGVIARPRLTDRLARATSTPVTLVSAPAGFGKTTLLAELAAAAAESGPVAWLSVDRADNDGGQLWAYLVEAVDRAIPGSGGRARVLLESDGRVESALAALINDLGAAPDDLVVVIDDYHLVDEPTIQSGMAFLVEHLPPRVHLVLGTRADPALPLARLRATGRLVEIRAGDLRFSTDEASAYLNGSMGLTLGADEVAALDARAEGWVAALQLAGRSLQGRADPRSFIEDFAGDDRYVVDYLAEEVLHRQPPDVREFLLRTSILRRLSGPLCDAVTERQGGAAQLEALDRANLFLVALDDRRRWYRYHHLFGDVLHARLLAQEPGILPALHRRASAWLEADGDAPEAIRHALEGGDLERAARLIEIATPEMQRTRREGTLRGWMTALPRETFDTRPVLAVGYVGALMADGTMTGVESLLADAERWLGPDGRPIEGAVVADAAQADRLPRAIAMYRAALALGAGDLDDTSRQAGRALALAPDDDHLGRGAAGALIGLARWHAGDLDAAYEAFETGMASLERGGFLADVVGGAVTLADIRIEQGRLGDALRLFEEGLALATRPGRPVLRGAADMHVGIAMILTERDDLAGAIRHLAESRALGDENGAPKHPWRWRLATARVRQAEGDATGAARLVEAAEPLYATDFSPDVRPIAAVKARAALANGDLAAAERWARNRGISPSDEVTYLREFELATLARVRLAQGGRDGDAAAIGEAVRLAERILESAEADHRDGAAIEAGVVLALARNLAGEEAGAVDALERAAGLGDAEGYTRVFLDEGQPMAALLRLAVQRGASKAVRRLADRAASAGSGTRAAAAVQPGLIEPLSERELEVLRLLQGELDGPAIADHLFVSVNTVRTHTKNIYAKLDVNSRRAAVRRATELGLLPREGTPPG